MSRFISVATIYGDVVVNTQHIIKVEKGQRGANLLLTQLDSGGESIMVQTEVDFAETINSIIGEEESCSDCIYAKGITLTDTLIWQCRRNPPSVSGYPEIDIDDDCCGEYQTSLALRYRD